MISVVIPVLNEANTIADVVAIAHRDCRVSEVIVVDDGSIDGTPERARAEGAIVITSSLLGKGASMEDGLRVASGDIVLYLDGDLRSLVPDLVARLADPIAAGYADFVKARFTREAGRVTTLTARPLLATLFPEAAHFVQPLGGIIAARRSTLEGLPFENDYGVDIGLLLDALARGARVVEVDVGHLEHDSQPLDRLGEMARQVTRAILARALRGGRLVRDHFREVEEVERHTQAEVENVLARTDDAQRLALLDMDGTLVDGRFITRLAAAAGRTAAVSEWLDRDDLGAEERTRRIADTLRGVPKSLFATVARELPLASGAIELVVGLRKRGYRVGLVTDSFLVAADIVRRRVFADFTIAHLMRFRDGAATGEITLAPAMRKPDGCPDHDPCKANVVAHLATRTGIAPDRILAIGDGENDRCLFGQVGRAIAYRPQTPAVGQAAHHVVPGGSLERVLTLVA